MRQLEQEYSGHAEGESDLKQMCQPGESCRNQEIKSKANYCCNCCSFRSLSSKRSTNVMQGTNMEITSLACFRHVPAYLTKDIFESW